MKKVTLHRFSPLILLVVLVLILSACSQPPTPTTSASTIAPSSATPKPASAAPPPSSSAPAPPPSNAAPKPTSAAPPAAAPVKPVELKFATHGPPQHYLIKQSWEAWLAELDKRTGGRVKVTIYPAETLGKAAEMFDMVQKGTCDISHVTFSYHIGRFPLADVFEVPYLLPYGAKDKTGKLMQDFVFEKYINPAYFKGMNVMWSGRFAPLVIHGGKKAVRTIEDAKGVLLGFPGGKTTPKLITALGATPEMVTMPDAYSALERGMIDGMIVPLTVQQDFKLYEVAKRVTLMNSGAGVYGVMMTQKNFDSLPADIQKIFSDLNSFAADLDAKAADGYVNTVANLCKQKGVELIELAAQERARWADATKGIEKEWATEIDKQNLPGTKMVEDIRASIAK